MIRKTDRLIYVFKPVSTLLVIAVAVAAAYSSGGVGNFNLLIILGLIFSLGGDLALMPPDTQNRFRIGLILFLTAHVLYLAAFWKLGAWALPDLLIGAGLLVVVVSYYMLLRPNLGSMKIPVIIYILVICLMVSRASSTLFAGNVSREKAVLMFVGAILFLLSDVMLSANRFWKPWKYERSSLAFYFSGQLCFALSVGIPQ